MSDKLWIVVPAAGSGARMGGELPKQYITLGEHSMLQHTLTTLLKVPDVEGIVVCLAQNDPAWADVPAAADPRVHDTPGGDTRADSVLAGLRFVQQKADRSSWVLIHDAARPLVALSDIRRLTDAVFNSGAIGGLLATPVHDTLKHADEYCRVERTVSRQHLWQAQTPQLFRSDELIEALQGAARGTSSADTITDESSAMEGMGHEPLLVEALHPNLKVTRPVDLELARVLLSRAGDTA